MTFTRRVDLEASGFLGWSASRMIGTARKRNDRSVDNDSNALERA